MSRRLLAGVLMGSLLVLVPLAAHAGKSKSWSNGYSTSDDGDEFNWAVFDPSNGSSSCHTTGEDWQDVMRSLRDEKDVVMWFKLDGRRYVIRDADLVERATEIVAPMQELGKRQGALGAKQGELGRKQGALGARQGELGRKQAELGARQAALSARLSRAVANADEDGESLNRRERREIEMAMRELGQLQRELGQLQRDLGEQQRPLGQVQSELGARQSELGREQARQAARVGVELKRLAEEALREGKAVPLRTRRSI